LSAWIWNLTISSSGLKRWIQAFQRPFLGGFCCTKVLVSTTGECTLMNDDGDSIHEGDDNDMVVSDHGNKNISSTRIFLHHCCTWVLENWRASCKTRWWMSCCGSEDNPKSKQTYTEKVCTTTEVSLSLLTILFLRNCNKFLLKNQSINWQTKSIINFLLLTKTISPNFVVDYQDWISDLIGCYKTKLHSGIEVPGFFLSMRISCRVSVFHIVVSTLPIILYWGFYLLPIGLLPLIRTYMILHIHDTLRLEDYYFCYF
jgi:hypothetical protein